MLRPSDRAINLVRAFGATRGLEGRRILDIVSGDGGLSIALSRAGAHPVLGVEGRELHVDHTQFVDAHLSVTKVEYRRDGPRRTSADKYGLFELAMCFSTLHHLGNDDFLPFLLNVASVTRDMLVP